ncbi:MAG TPA: tetratricopeptide repeat protein [Blastocatellia bacterium]|nr:tetratricopeptide repeat protein [Blastocatellia bacterium]
MLRIRISEKFRLLVGWSFRHLAIVPLLLALCLIPQSQVFSQPARVKEREGRILEIQRLFGQGDLGGARKLLDEASKMFPGDAGLDNLLGIIEAQEGNFAAAERSFKRALTRDRKFTGAYLNLGRLYQERSADDPQALTKALNVYRRLLRYEPVNAEANYQSAVLLMMKDAYHSSLDHLLRLPAKMRESAQVLSVSCANYAGLGRAERANEMARRLIAHPDFSEPDVSAILPALTGGGRDDLSVELLEGLRKRRPLSAESTRRLGLAYERAGKLIESRAALELSVSGDRPAVALLVELARVARKQRDYQGALGYLAHARDLEPNNAGLHYFFGLGCLDLNLVAEARAAFERAVKIEPENPAYNYATGAASTFRHDPEEAIPYFEKYVQLKPQDARGKLALGAALLRAKRYDEATSMFMKVVKVPGASTAAHYYLGSIARQNGRLDDAIQELNQALKADPDYADALAELGQCYLMRREHEQAGKLLRRALEIDPDHYTANFNLLTLYARTKDPNEASQAARFEEVKKMREEKSQEFLRMIEVRPYSVP